MILSILADLVLILKLDLLRARIQAYSMIATMMLVWTPKIHTSIKLNPLLLGALLLVDP